MGLYDKALRDAGLSNNEIKVYLALLELGSVRASPILQKTGLQNSALHLSINGLIKKGLVSFVREGRIRSFQACDPQNLVRLLDEKRMRLEKIVPKLISKQKMSATREAEVFEGIPGFKSMLYKFIEGARKGEEYLFFGFFFQDEDCYEDIFEFYGEFEEERLRRGLKIKGIIPIEVKHRNKLKGVRNLRFVDFPTLVNHSVCMNRVIITPWERDRQTSFLITSPELSENYRKYFYSIWNTLR